MTKKIAYTATYRKKWNCFLLLTTLLLTSCVKEYWQPDEPDDDQFLSMTVMIPSVQIPQTRAINEADENRIDHIDILSFVKEGAEEVFSYRISVSGADISDVTSGNSNGNKKTFQIKLKRLSEGQRLMVIANAKSSVDALESQNILVEGATKQSIHENLVFDGTQWSETKMTNSFQPFPMWGQTASMIYANRQSVSIDPVSLLRSVAKVDIGVDIGADPALGFGRLFKIKRIYVYRINDKGTLAPAFDEADYYNITKPNIPTGTSQQPRLEYTYAYDGDEDAMVRHIYIPEADAATVGTEQSSICIVVGATYYDNPESYYRIDFVENQKFVPVLRNHRYLFNITRAYSYGYSDPDMAAISRSQILDYQLNISEEDIDDIIYNSQYMLGVTSSKIKTDWKKKTFEDLRIYTTYPYGWTAETDADWLRVVDQEGSGNYNMAVRLYVNDNFVEPRQATVTLRAGNLTKTVKVTQTMGANSYIFRPNTMGGYLEFPVAQANADGIMRIDYDEGIDYVLIWQDNPNLTHAVGKSPHYQDSVWNHGSTWAFLYRPYEGEYGNALVGIKSKTTGEMLWSWHIWVTEYNPDDPDQQKTVNGRVFMDRNLGAWNANEGDFRAFGLYYQWGRKDPFPYPEGYNGVNGTRKITQLYRHNHTGIVEPTAISYSTAVSDYEQARKNPTTFYYNTSSYYNWITTGHNNYWSTPSGEKAIYDPCPEGWRVPTSGNTTASPWYSFTTSNVRYVMDGTSILGAVWDGNYYPAAGGMDFYDANFVDVKVRGYAWASTAMGFQAYCLNFGSSAVNTSSTNYRAGAQPVRCEKIPD